VVEMDQNAPANRLGGRRSLRHDLKLTPCGAIVGGLDPTGPSPTLRRQPDQGLRLAAFRLRPSPPPSSPLDTSSVTF
jgi:hypothetical protein